MTQQFLSVYALISVQPFRDIADDFLNSEDGDRLTSDIDTNLEVIMQNALANHGNC